MKFFKRHVLKATLVVVLLLVFVVPSFAAATNGSFEAGDFSGWGTFHSGFGSIYVATSSPGIADGSLPSDGITDGIYAAYFDADGGNTSIIWQDVTGGGTMSVDITYNNSAGTWAFTGILDENSGANQYFRIDIMDPASASTSMAAGDILMTVFASSAATPFSADKQTFSADLSAYAGQTVRIRIAKGDNLFFFPFVVDNLVVTTGGGQGVAYNKINQVRVTAPGTPLYESAGGNVVRDGGGNEIWVPNGTAHNPYEDVYDVISSVEIDGTTWVEIFIGSATTYVWIPVGPSVQLIY